VRVGELYAWKKEFKRHGKMSASLRGGTGRPGPLPDATDPRVRDAEFSEEFKREAVRRLESSGQPASRIARELKIPVNKLYQWRKKYAGAA
jgi:transposase-like protein